MRKTLTVVLAAATMGMGFSVPAATAKPIIPDIAAMPQDPAFQQVQNRRNNRCYPGERNRDCRERMRWERRHGGR